MEVDWYVAAVVVITAIDVAAVARLVGFRLHKTFPWLIAFLLYQALQNLVVLLVPARSKAYQQFYTFSEPLNFVFYVLLIREMYRGAFADFPGIASMGKYASYASFALAVAVSVVMVIVTPAYKLNQTVIFGYVVYWEKCAFFALTIFVLFMILVLSRFPVHLNANLVTNIVIFTIYFFGNFASLQFSSTETPRLLLLRNYLMLGLSGFCFLAWGLILRPTASSSQIQIRRGLDSGEEQRLMSQLGALNHLLGKTSGDLTQFRN